MVERWLEVHVFFTEDQARNVPTILQDVIKYCADELKSGNQRKTFHFLFEPRIDGNPDFEILFRIEAGEKVSLDEIEEAINARVDEFLNLVDGRQITRGYHGEAGTNQFGEDGWDLAKQLFEIGSEIAIGQMSETFRKGDKFVPGKLVHCFLNQQRVNEERFHAIQLIGRAMITLGANSLSPRVEGRVRELMDEALATVRSSQIRML